MSPKIVYVQIPIFEEDIEKLKKLFKVKTKKDAVTLAVEHCLECPELSTV